MVEQSNLLTTEELMAWLSISRSTVFRLMKKGLPYVNIGGERLLRFDRDEVDAWIKSQKQSA